MSPHLLHMRKHIFFLIIFVALGLIYFGVQAKPVHAAISIVQSSTLENYFSGTPTVTLSANVNAGDAIVVMTTGQGADQFISTTTPPTDTLGAVNYEIPFSSIFI
jgi:hypothetical protein